MNSAFIWLRDCKGAVRYWDGEYYALNRKRALEFDTFVEAEKKAGSLAGRSVSCMTGSLADQKLPTAERWRTCPEHGTLLLAESYCPQCEKAWPGAW